VRVFNTACESAPSPQMCQNNGQTEKSNMDWGQQSCRFCSKKFPVEKESVRQRVIMMQQLVFFAKVRGEVFAYFHAVAVKRHSGIRKLLS
jgi:hypothetical protein